jgi:hypothetical protein
VSKRLGTVGGAAMVSRHRFFRGRDWARVLARGYVPLFTPPLKDAADTANFDSAFTDEPVLCTRSRPEPGPEPGSEPGPEPGPEPPAALLGEHAEAASPFVGWDTFISV